MREGFLQRELANLAISPIRLPIMNDVPVLPILPERLHIDASCADVAENALERTIGAFANADQRAEHIKRNQLRPQTLGGFTSHRLRARPHESARQVHHRRTKSPPLSASLSS